MSGTSGVVDSREQMQSEDVDVSTVLLVNGAPCEQLIKHNGQALSAAQQRKQEAALGKLRRETTEERAVRLREEQANRSFIREAPLGFIFRLIGEEVVNGRPAYVLPAMPNPAYRPRGLFLARVQPGSHVRMEQIRVGDGVWLPGRIEARVNATVLFLMSYNIDRILTWSNYLPVKRASLVSLASRHSGGK